MEISRRKFFQLGAVAGCSAACAVATPAQARGSRVPGPDEFGMLNDSARCIGCRACQVACKEANQLPLESTTGEAKKLGHEVYDSPRALSDKTFTLVKLHPGENGGEATFVKQQCMHCVEPACQSACIVGALKKQPNGAVVYDSDLCMGCRYCIAACPFNVPQFEWSRAIPSIRKCTLCAETRLKKGQPTACSTACPAGAVTFGKRADLLKLARKRIEEEPERYNAKVYGEEEVGGTNVFYLTRKDVKFAGIGLPGFGYRSVSGLTESIQHRIFQYFIPPVAVYGLLGGVMAYNQRRKKLAEQEGGDDEC